MGGGIAGLATALALSRRAAAESASARRYEVVIVERDPAPPELSPEQAFERWERPGVPQFRHAHILLARLQTILRDDYPELLAQLQAAGLELSRLDEVLPEQHVGRLAPLPEDRDLLHLWGRRPTFEYVVRRHVAQLPHVRFVHSARVERLIADVDASAGARTVRVRGVELLREGQRERLDADVVVDASGKRSKLGQQLAELGVKVDSVRFPSDRVYVCRHYRLREPSTSLQRMGTGANLDYFGYATFYAEHGHYAITLSCPVEEQELAQKMSKAHGFESLCAQFPVLASWTRQSEPTSKVLGAGAFENRWTTHGAPGGHALHGFFAVGDAQLETNPMYGRGCASAFVQAKLLAETLAASRDPGKRGELYRLRAREQLQVHFDFCVQTDNMFRSRGRLARGEPVPAGERLLKYLYEEAWTPAMERSQLVAREMIKAMQMRELSGVGTRLAVALVIAVTYLALRLRRAVRPASALGPERTALIRALPSDSDGG